MNCLKNFHNQQYQLQGSITNTKNIGKINTLFALVHDSDARCAEDAPQLSNTTNHLFSTLHIPTRTRHMSQQVCPPLYTA